VSLAGVFVDGKGWGWSGWVGRRAAVHPVPAESSEVDERQGSSLLRRTTVRAADELDDSGTNRANGVVREHYESSLSLLMVLYGAEVVG
jgi:hypothetical protein